ncbi:CapA family protein [Patescibacteria group bacterium]|nr:CapA family protein [Patescibacteria group bacterium]
MKKTFGVLLIFGLLGLVGWLGYQHREANSIIHDLNSRLTLTTSEASQVGSLEENVQELQEQLTQREKVYTILAGGDIMLDRGVEAALKRDNLGYEAAFDLIRDDLRDYDLVFANLEGSISDVGADTGKAYSFRFEPIVADALASAGIDIVSLANNHMLDWGRESLCETTRHLDHVMVAHVGAGCDRTAAEAPYLVNLGDTTLAFLAYTEFYQGAHATTDRPGITEYDLDIITDRIKTLKQRDGIDLVFVSMHWGTEYKPRANDTQVQIGQQLVDAGADVVIGHHPHVTQEIERYDEGWIIYSLGNFVFDQDWSAATMQGLLAEIVIKEGKVDDVVPRAIQLNNRYQPSLVLE